MSNNSKSQRRTSWALHVSNKSDKSTPRLRGDRTKLRDGSEGAMNQDPALRTNASHEVGQVPLRSSAVYTDN